MITLRTLFLFYRRHLRVQPLRELMAVIGVAAGVALFFTVQIANGSVTGSFKQITRGVAGRASLEVAARSPQGFDEGVDQEVEGTPGVEASAPILEQRIVAVGPRGSRALILAGADERLVALGGKLPSQFQQAEESSKRGLMVTTEPTAKALGVGPGSVVTIKVGERTEQLSLAATVPSDKIGSLAESPVAAASLPVVQSLARLPGRVTRIVVEPQPGRSDEVRQTLSRHFGDTLNVRSIDSEARFLAQAARPEGQVATLFSVISVVVGMILAYNALLLASGERRAFIRYLSDLGTPDATIIASLAFDAFILGIVGCALGLLLGDLISSYAYRAAPGYLTAAFAIGGQRVVGLETILIALAAGMFAAFVAAALPAIGILRSSAAEANAAARPHSLVGKPHRTDLVVFAAGVLLICVSVLASVLRPAVTIVALVGLAAGLMICIPMIVRYILRAARAGSRHLSDPAARLSTGELQASPTRSIALVATGTIAVFLTVLIGGPVADVQHGVHVAAKETASGADLWVRPGGPENVYAVEPFAGTDAARGLQRAAAVGLVLPYRGSFLDLPDRRVWVIGIPPQAAAPIAESQLVDGQLSAADQRLREGGWAAISQVIASQRHLRLGERFALPTPSGTASFRLAATVSNYGWIPGAVLLNGDDYARFWGSTDVSELAVTLRPEVSLEQGKLAVERALPTGSALTVQTSAERRAQIATVLGSTLSRLSETSSVVLFVAIAAVVAMMVGAVWQRRGRLDALMSIGMSVGQLARLVFYETGAVLLSGCLIGMAAGIVAQGLGDNWLNRVVGVPAQFAPAWQLGLRTILLTTLISVAVAVIAVLRTVRFEPKAAFSTE